MKLRDFKRIHCGNSKPVLMNKRSAKELCVQIDNPAIFEKLTHGEYFQYGSIKVFIDSKNFSEYCKYLKTMGVEE